MSDRLKQITRFVTVCKDYEATCYLSWCLSEIKRQREEIERLRRALAEAIKERDALRAMLRRLEWVYVREERPRCLICLHAKENVHAPDCALAALLKGEGDER